MAAEHRKGVGSETVRFGTRLWALAAALAAKLAFSLLGCHQEPAGAPERPATRPGKEGSIVLTIVYDNNPGRADLTPAWGFACLVQGTEKTILFDTGGDGGILMDNFRRLGLDANEVDAIVLSHVHGDHTGGLASFLRVRTGVPVYLPGGFPAAFKQRVRALGARPIDCDDSQLVCEGVRTTGTLGRGAIEEHALCIRTGRGWMVITGCAHPGVENLAAAAKELTGGPLDLVIGGFHMGGHSGARIRAAMDRLEKLGVRRAGPCHCSGNGARKLFQQRFADRCLLPGVGTVVRLDGNG